MAEHAPSAPEPTRNAEVVSRRPMEAKPRREPYRPSSSAVLSNASSSAMASVPSQQLLSQTSFTQVDVPRFTSAAAATYAAGTPPPRSTTTLPLPHEGLTTTTSVAIGHEDALRRASAASIARSPTATTSADPPTRCSDVGVPGPAAREAAAAAAVGVADIHAVASTTTPVRSSAAESPTQQRRSTLYSLSSAHQLVVSPQHRRAMSYVATSSFSTTAAAAAAAAAAALTGGDARRQLHARTLSSPSGVTPGNAASSAPPPATTTTATVAEVKAALPSDGQPLHNQSSLLSFRSANEAAAPPMGGASLAEVLAFSPAATAAAGSPNAVLVAVAHIMQRESTRQLLSRVLLRWSLLHKTRQPLHRNGKNNGERADDAGGGGGGGDAGEGRAHSVPREVRGAACVSRSASSTLTIDSTVNVHANTKRRSASNVRSTSPSGEPAVPVASPLPPWKPIAGGGVRADSLSVEDRAAVRSDDDDDEVADSGRADAAEERESVRRSAAAFFRQQRQRRDADAASTGKPAAAGRGSTQESPQPTQAPVPTPQRTNSASAHDSSNLNVSGPSSVSSTFGQGNLNTNDNNSNSPTASSNMTTPRAQTTAGGGGGGGGGGGEARRKSIVAQYLAGKPPGNLSPQLQSSATPSSYANAGPATSGVMDAHTFSLPGAMFNPHSRSPSGVSSTAFAGGALNSSFPRRRSEGMWGPNATTTAFMGGAAHTAGFSDSEEHSSSSLYYTPCSRRSNGVSGTYASFDDDHCLSSSSMSMAAMAAASAATATSPVAHSIPQLLAREVEKRGLLLSSESRRRGRMQTAMSAQLDQLIMMALHRRTGERGLHPSLRASTAPSPMATPHSMSSGSSNSSSVSVSVGSGSRNGDVAGNDVVNYSCSATECSAQGQWNEGGGNAAAAAGGGVGRRRVLPVSGPRSSGQASTRSSGSIGAAALLGAPQRATTPSLSHPLPLSPTSYTRPHLSVATSSSFMSRRLSHTKRGSDTDDVNDNVSAPAGDADSRSDASRGDDDDAARSPHRIISNESSPRHRHRRQQHQHLRPLRRGTPLGRNCDAAEDEHEFEEDDDDDDDGADTATVHSECTVHGFATTRQWVAQQMPESTAAAAAAAATRPVSESASLDRSFASTSLSQPLTRDSSAVRRKRSV
ncbi:hypothetical protein ABB37_09649 [Leptomonas pyrrhocoris]|uniref:Uncharacterized protein n=1 Tax=Leptomonas pyrrhocoris TaxID=157538 RepID=A0A0M9FQ25_LEPPY|nr:hypothetical protein ABB37_09649 [Leptomonas pyrrhocoris]KPA73750.1 hypothetical protein ABB37_09649 [Leptomonas pyrrhocoris]|eukprot:XP_015652189.1 hypothetical protein ABB37_09649 [Leptomonas pyrrhocoris]